MVKIDIISYFLKERINNGAKTQKLQITFLKKCIINLFILW